MNPVSYFELPVKDMDRAIKFYEFVFEIKMNLLPIQSPKMAMFPGHPEHSGTSGSLVYHEDFYNPSGAEGVLLYFNCEDVEISMNRVGEAGGDELITKRMISESAGYMGAFLDTEGNRVALHSRK